MGVLFIPLYLTHLNNAVRIKTTTMKVQVNTKSNYRNLNGQWLNVTEANGTRVSVLVDFDGVPTTVDFTLKEVSAIKYN